MFRQDVKHPFFANRAFLYINNKNEDIEDDDQIRKYLKSAFVYKAVKKDPSNYASHRTKLYSSVLYFGTVLRRSSFLSEIHKNSHNFFSRLPLLYLPRFLSHQNS